MKLEEGIVILLINNKAHRFHDTGTVRLKMFDYREYLLHMVSYVPKLNVSMFNDLDNCTRVEHFVLKILYYEVIMAKRSKYMGYIFLKVLMLFFIHD